MSGCTQRLISPPGQTRRRSMPGSLFLSSCLSCAWEGATGDEGRGAGRRGWGNKNNRRRRGAKRCLLRNICCLAAVTTKPFSPTAQALPPCATSGQCGPMTVTLLSSGPLDQLALVRRNAVGPSSLGRYATTLGGAIVCKVVFRSSGLEAHPHVDTLAATFPEAE